jgi:hypothetical protein
MKAPPLADTSPISIEQIINALPSPTPPPSRSRKCESSSPRRHLHHLARANVELPPLDDTSPISIERTSTSDDQSATISLGRITTSNNPSIGNTPLELSLNNNHSLAVRLVNSHRDREK